MFLIPQITLVTDRRYTPSINVHKQFILQRHDIAEIELLPYVEEYFLPSERETENRAMTESAVKLVKTSLNGGLYRQIW